MPVSAERMAGENVRWIGGAELSHLIGASHLSWRFDPERTRQLRAGVAIRSVGAIRLAWVRSNAWSGRRTAEDIASNPEPYLTVLMPLRGTIALRSRWGGVDVHVNELGFWDSRQIIAFETNDPDYEQLSVLVPQRMLRAAPEACAALHCTRVDRTNVLSELCVQHMATLAQFLDGELKPYEMSLSSVTTSLLDAVIASVYRSPHDRDRLLADMLDYVECYITEDDLSARTIAGAFEVSTRYVHKLFEAKGCSVRDWIIDRRLERSADDLLQNKASITEIAHKWGFKDLGHYSRSFRRKYGLPPSRYQEDGGGRPEGGPGGRMARS
jgi:AraC-like DNA-binding protein